MNDFKLKIIDSTGHTVVSNLNDTCSACFIKASNSLECKCPNGKGIRRIGKKRDAERREFFACMQGGKKQHQFDIAMSTLVESFTLFAICATEPEGGKVARLIHDVSGVLGRNHFYALIPQHRLMETKYQDQLKVVQDIQKAKPTEICKTLIYLHKDNEMMSHLFTIYKVLDCNDKSKFSKLNHKLHSLLLNVLYLWRNDFDDKKVRIHVADSDAKVTCDFNTVQAAFILFLDNAFKYTKHNSEIQIMFDEDNDWCNLSFEMCSLLVKPEERTLIFETGKRGELTNKKTDLRGQGIGLGRIRSLLLLNDGGFRADWGDKVDADEYVKNRFVFQFKRAKPSKRR